MSNICGHDRRLLVAGLLDRVLGTLSLEARDASPIIAASGAAEIIASCDAMHKVYADIDEPAKIAAIICETLRGFGVSARLRLLVQDGEWPDVEILYFPNEHRPHVPVPKVGFFIRPTHQNIDLTMHQARAIELRLLERNPVKARSVELIRETINGVIRSREYAVESARRQVGYREDTMKTGRSQGARTRATNERAGCVEDLAKRETGLTEAVEALREFNEEHS